VDPGAKMEANGAYSGICVPTRFYGARDSDIKRLKALTGLS